MTEDHRYSVSVAGVIVDDQGRALIIQRRDNGHWEPPGGILEHGETIEDGLRREVYEETGLSIDIDSLTGVYQNMPRGIIALVFRCRTTGGRLTTNHEVQELRWADRDEIPSLASEAYAVRFTDALDYRSFAAVRPHDGVVVLQGLPRSKQ